MPPESSAVNISLPSPPGNAGELKTLFVFGDTGADAPIHLTALTPQPTEIWRGRGPVVESVFGQFVCRRSPDYLFLSAQVPVGGESARQKSEVRDSGMQDTRTATRLLYRELVKALASHERPTLLRCWNYVPDINRGEGDFEVYRQFCWGRAEALGENGGLGANDEGAMAGPSGLPAATAIGSHDGVLRISALAAREGVTVTHVENPRQLSAYRYPRIYGPRSPSFARATWFTMGADEMLLLSGTSSIVDHRTCHAGDVSAQTAETRRNIEQLLQSAPGPHSAAHATGLTNHWQAATMRYYLRNPRDLNTATHAYSQAFTGFPAAAMVQADICRSDLTMEIDGVLVRPGQLRG